MPAGFSARQISARYLRKLDPGNVQQTGIGPDAVIGFDLVEVMEQQRLDRAAETARSHLGHFRRSIGRRGRRSPAPAFPPNAAPAPHPSSRILPPGGKQREKASQPRVTRGDLALGIGLRVAAVELQRLLVHSTLLSPDQRCLMPSGKPSISRMFCTAAPEAPLPRLSRRATRTA